MSVTNRSIATDHADLMAYDAIKNGQIPPMYVDGLTGRIIADISLDSRDAFLADAPLQRYLSAKMAVWRVISELRNKGGRQ